MHREVGPSAPSETATCIGGTQIAPPDSERLKCSGIQIASFSSALRHSDGRSQPSPCRNPRGGITIATRQIGLRVPILGSDQAAATAVSNTCGDSDNAIAVRIFEH